MQIGLNHIHTHTPRFLWMRETRKTTSYTKKEQKTTRNGRLCCCLKGEWKAAAPRWGCHGREAKGRATPGPVWSPCSWSSAPRAFLQLPTHSDTVQHTLSTPPERGRAAGSKAVPGKAGFSRRWAPRARLRLRRCPLPAHTQLSRQDTHQQGSRRRGKNASLGTYMQDEN